MSRLVSDKVAKRRLEQLCDLLESLPKERFNFSTFGEAADTTLTGSDLLENATQCGTTACAIGWAPSLDFAKKMGIKLLATEFIVEPGRKAARFSINGFSTAAEEVAELLFGLSLKQFDALFMPNQSPFKGAPTSKASPKKVAANIRKFIALRYA